MTASRNFLTKDKSFYKQLLILAFPIALQNLINISVAMADTFMLGLLGEKQLAAANLSNKFGTIFVLFTFGLGAGANVLIAQFWGKGNIESKESIRKIMTIMYRALFVGALIFSFIAIFFPLQAMRIFSLDVEVQQYGVEYLRVIGFTYLIAGIVSTTTTLLRSVGTLKITLIIYTSSLITNAFLNWVLIFGKLGAPALGMAGGAIATLIARVVEFIILIIYMSKYEDKIQYKFKDLFLNVRDYLKRFFKHSVPVVINDIIWGAGFTIISIIIGRMGTEFTAADSVMSVLGQLVTIFIWGIAHASSAIIGNTIGAGKEDKVKEYARTLITLAMVLGALSSVAILVIKNPMVSIFNISDLAKSYAKQMINVYSVLVFFQAIGAVSLMGILRGSGNSTFVLFMDMFFMWVVCIPLGALVGLKLGWPIWAVYAVLKSDEVFKGIFSLIKIKKGDWIKNLTK